MFKIDELTKKHIWKKNKRKQKWTKLRYIDLFLLVLSVYCPCFFILHSVLNPDFTYFYGPYGNITTYGRVMTMIIRTSIVYISTSIPYLIVHFFYLITAGKDLVTRFNEKIELSLENNEETLIYNYKELTSPFSKKTIIIKLKDIEKVTYVEETNKIHIYGNILEEIQNKKSEYNKEIDVFTLFSYFTPDILHIFKEKNIKIEYLFFADKKRK